MTRIEKVLEGLNSEHRRVVESTIIYLSCPTYYGFEINYKECNGKKCVKHWNQEVDGE